jgi:glutathione S-transferase
MIALYELRGLGDRRYSTFSWRSRMALLHKGLDAEIRPVRISDKAAIAFSNQTNVPILVDGERVVPDSWRIAEYLEETYPDRPSLFGGGAAGRAQARFFNSWTDRQVIPAIVPYLALDVLSCVDTEDGVRVRSQMERFFGAPLEDHAAKRGEGIKRFRVVLAPVRDVLRGGAAFLGGDRPLYADYILFGVLIWARIVSPAQVLAPDDAVAGWFERMLDLYGGVARQQPVAAGGSGGR